MVPKNFTIPWLTGYTAQVQLIPKFELLWEGVYWCASTHLEGTQQELVSMGEHLLPYGEASVAPSQDDHGGTL